MRPRKPGLLQRVWGFDSRHPLWWDLGPPVFVFLGMLIGTAVMEESAAKSWLIILIVVLFLGPAVWRRRYPFAVFLILNVGGALNLLSGLEAPPVDTAAGFAFITAMFNVALRRSARYVWIAAAVVAAQTVLELFTTSAGSSLEEIVATVTGGIAVFGLVTLVGVIIKTRRDFHQSVSDQAAWEAVVSERTRIAREMHDIIGHNLAVINALADGGAYAAERSPERAKEALTAIGSTSRQALSELRRVLSVLNVGNGQEAAELAPQPGLSDLGALVERVREAGLPVTVKITGEPWALSENQQLAVYRTVQEALTNVLKHAPGPRRAQVSLAYRADGLNVAVANTGPVAVDPGTRRGLAGLQERAAAFGGTMEAGPQPAGGWRVALWLPREKEPTS